MTREEIESTDWAKQLWENSTPSSYREIVKRMAVQTPVFIAWMGDSAEITLGSYTIHSMPTMEDALEWCKRFELPIEMVDGKPYHDDSVSTYRELVKQLSQWLGDMGNDKTLPVGERSAYFNVQAKINQLMKEQK